MIYMVRHLRQILTPQHSRVTLSAVWKYLGRSCPVRLERGLSSSYQRKETSVTVQTTEESPSKVFNRIILDPQLRDNQAGFRKNRTLCTDQIATLRIIVEHSLEWNSPLSPLYINFVDCEKAFDSMGRQTLWKLLRYYGVSNKLEGIRAIVMSSLDYCSCRNFKISVPE